MTTLSKSAAATVIAILVTSASSTQAGTVTFSPTQPTFDLNDITQLQGGVFATAPEDLGGDRGRSDDNANYIASDRPAQGQTFTVSQIGLQLDSITVKLAGGFISIPAETVLTLRVNTVIGNVLTTISTDTAVLPQVSTADNGPTDFLTFTLSAPVAVSPGVTYGFDFGNTTGNPGFYFRIDGAADSSYLSGTSYSSGNRSGIGTTEAVIRDTDRTFGIMLSPVPEPSVAMFALTSGAGVLALRRRRSA
jgi:hypothetical protein